MPGLFHLSSWAAEIGLGGRTTFARTLTSDLPIFAVRAAIVAILRI